MKYAKGFISLVIAIIFLTACATRSEPVQPSAPDSNIQSDTNQIDVAPVEASSVPNEPDLEDKPSKQAASGKVNEPANNEPLKPEYRMNSVYRFEPLGSDIPANKVLLTFDDGPKDAVMLNSMLATLDKHHAKAIFFVNGYRVKANPELLKKLHEQGQTIGNHSWDHIDLKKQDKAEVVKQIGDVQDIVKELTGKAPRFFRPPFGSGNDAVRQTAKDHGMLYMTWSNGSLDWDLDKEEKNKPDKVIQNVLEQLHPGANILMHELPWTAEALDELLSKLEEKGYGFIDPQTIELEHADPLNAE
ncbi:polysaccharide deacetylase family protein [Paenibacillus abyssi]|uniref:NodB homology domain-containing protein n=1 Tax=Paenibacillus abyssi TaxID=1340531 RepID=A0A917CGD2_9BACL|nr:polysaccharide deacetylase family protein [Paenibacillus abyssi]GGF87694.1 hypothetical protein GCM10010916_01260 [Paenibacillus abyssi]